MDKHIDIPIGWKIANLRRLTLDEGILVDGDWVESKDQDPQGDVRLVQLADIGDGDFLDKSNRFMTRAKADELKCTFLEQGDILIARMPDPIGRACIFPGLNLDAVTAVDVCIVRTNKRVDRYWLMSAINSFEFRTEALNQASGTTRTRISRRNLEKIPVLLPPLPEQRAIAAILGTWDRAIAFTERRLAAAEQRKKALMQQLLTGEVRFPEFVGEAWREMQLGEFLTMKLRKVPKPSDSYLALGIRSHGKGTFHKEVDDPDDVAMSHLYKVKTGDLIVNITFAWEGAIALVGDNDDGRLVSHRFPTYIFDRKKVESDFFGHLMLTKQFFYKLGLISPGGAGRNRVMSKRDFLRIKVKLPSLREQKRCAAILCAADKEVELLTKKRDALQQQKKGLMQRLLTGRVRVKV